MDLPTSQNNAVNIGLNRKGEQNSGDLSLTEADTVKNESTIGFGQAMYILLEVNNQTWSTAFMHLRQGSKPKGKDFIRNIFVLYLESNIVFHVRSF
jgi:hypothetical protein